MTAQNGHARDHGDDALTGDFLYAAGRNDLHIAFLCCHADAARECMVGVQFTACCHGQQCRFVHARSGNDGLYFQLAAAEGAVLFEYDGADVLERLEYRTAAEQNAVLSTRANAREQGKRNAENECTRIGNDQEGQAGMYPARPLDRKSVV